MSVRDVIIVGAGPSGLSAAIAAKQRGIDYQVLEQGVLVNSIFRFPPQMVFFTTPELLEIGKLPFVSPYEKPTRAEALNYYRKVVDHYDLRIAFDETVLSVSREEIESERLRPWRAAAFAPPALRRASPKLADSSGERRREDEQIRGEASAKGAGGARLRQGYGASTVARGLTNERRWRAPAPVEEKLAEHCFDVETRTSRGLRRVRSARTVIFATGYYDRPVMLNIPGEDLPHVRHFYGEPHPYYRQRVVVVGGGNSAAEAALELYRAGAAVTLVHRGPELKSTIKYWVRPDIENRFKEGSIAARFNSCVQEVKATSIIVRGPQGPEEIPADAVFLLVGYRADTDLFVRAGVELNARQAPVFDPETFETNIPGLFVAGGALAGEDTGTIFIENGRFHGEKILEVIGRRLGQA